MKRLLTTSILFVIFAASSFAGPLDGVWINTDAATQSIPKIDIDGTQLVWWGKTEPENSKYGPTKITFLGDSVNDNSPNQYGYVNEDEKFADRTFVIKRVGEHLVVESLTIFKDGSNRANYLEKLTFDKQP